MSKPLPVMSPPPPRSALLLASYYVASSFWMSSEARAWVVDAQTGEPVADAIVLASWEVKGLEGYRSVRSSWLS